ncbi:MAG: PEP-CTERM sorting domain-containing protein [Opitutales bacterium]
MLSFYQPIRARERWSVCLAAWLVLGVGSLLAQTTVSSGVFDVMDGDSYDRLDIENGAGLNMTGGSVSDDPLIPFAGRVRLFDNATGDISGGSIEEGVRVSQDSRLTFSGGTAKSASVTDDAQGVFTGGVISENVFLIDEATASFSGGEVGFGSEGRSSPSFGGLLSVAGSSTALVSQNASINTLSVGDSGAAYVQGGAVDTISIGGGTTFWSGGTLRGSPGATTNPEVRVIENASIFIYGNSFGPLSPGSYTFADFTAVDPDDSRFNSLELTVTLYDGTTNSFDFQAWNGTASGSAWEGTLELVSGSSPPPPPPGLIPEPATTGLLFGLAGLMGLLVFRRRATSRV